MGHPSPQNRLDLRQLIGAPAVLVTRRSATTSQARCGYTPVSHMTGRRVRMLPWDPLWRLRHVGYPVSPRGYRGLPAFASLSMAGSARCTSELNPRMKKEISRRAFLAGSAGALLMVSTPWAKAAERNTRLLSLNHTHTGEKLRLARIFHQKERQNLFNPL